MNSVILIPSLNPDDNLVNYIGRLVGYGFEKIIVVNDGSAAQYDCFFDKIAEYEQCIVLRHEVNRGKGAALKTGMNYYLENYAGKCDGIVTCDADGQHTLKDTANLTSILASRKDALILGSRDFSGKNIPVRSRFGNRMTSFVFKHLYGTWLSDTQTGLRAIPDSLVETFSQTDGERYEYEMKMLMDCAEKGIPIIEEPIETIYIDDNSGSHFNAVRDSARIYKVMLSNIFMYLLSSLTCVAVDLLLFTLFDQWALPKILGGRDGAGWDYLRIYGAAAGARICSSALNFTINKKLVFKKDGGTVASLGKYITVTVGNYLVSSFIVSTIHILTNVVATPIKMIVDSLLWIVTYTLQKKWVFKKTSDTEEEEE